MKTALAGESTFQAGRVAVCLNCRVSFRDVQLPVVAETARMASLDFRQFVDRAWIAENDH